MEMSEYPNVDLLSVGAFSSTTWFAFGVSAVSSLSLGQHDMREGCVDSEYLLTE